MPHTLSQKRVAQLERKQRLFALGLCTSCGKEPACVENPKFCSGCHAKDLQRQRDCYQRTRRIVFGVYAGAAVDGLYHCACCQKLKDPEFLTLDHVQGDGAKHRRQVPSATNLYWWLKKNDFPSGFQVLCADCNQSKGTGNECLHKQQQRNLLGKLAKVSLTY